MNKFNKQLGYNFSSAKIVVLAAFVVFCAPVISFAQSDMATDSIILKASQKYRLSPALIKAIIETESGFDPDARSHAGAIGLMQLMPKTGAHYGAQDPKNPSENIYAGARYLRELLNRFGGKLYLAIAAYNAGETVVQKFKGVPPFQETQKYVKKVLGRYEELKQIEYFSDDIRSSF